VSLISWWSTTNRNSLVKLSESLGVARTRDNKQQSSWFNDQLQSGCSLIQLRALSSLKGFILAICANIRLETSCYFYTRSGLLPAFRAGFPGLCFERVCFYILRRQSPAEGGGFDRRRLNEKIMLNQSKRSQTS